MYVFFPQGRVSYLRKILILFFNLHSAPHVMAMGVTYTQYHMLWQLA